MGWPQGGDFILMIAEELEKEERERRTDRAGERERGREREREAGRVSEDSLQMDCGSGL
jgi:hypothetical protein